MSARRFLEEAGLRGEPLSSYDDYPITRNLDLSTRLLEMLVQANAPCTLITRRGEVYLPPRVIRHFTSTDYGLGKYLYLWAILECENFGGILARPIRLENHRTPRIVAEISMGDSIRLDARRLAWVIGVPSAPAEVRAIVCDNESDEAVRAVFTLIGVQLTGERR